MHSVLFQRTPIQFTAPTPGDSQPPIRDWMPLSFRAPALVCIKSINIIKDKKIKIGAMIYTWPGKWEQADPGVSLVADLQASLVYLVKSRPIRLSPKQTKYIMPKVVL